VFPLTQIPAQLPLVLELELKFALLPLKAFTAAFAFRLWLETMVAPLKLCSKLKPSAQLLAENASAPQQY